MIVLTLEPGEAERLARGRTESPASLRDADRSRAVRAHCVVGAGMSRGRRRPAARAGGRGAASAAVAGSRDAARPARRPGADRRRGTRRRPRPGGARALVRRRRGGGGAAGRYRRGTQPHGRGPRPRPQARRPEVGAALHGAELRVRERRATVHGSRASIRSRPTRRRSRTSRPSSNADAHHDTSSEILAWAGEPLATAEVALIAQLDPRDARAALSRVATPIAAGADFYWTESAS